VGTNGKPLNLSVAATFQVKLAGSPVRNAKFIISRGIVLTDKQCHFLVAKLCPELTANHGYELVKTGKNGKCLKILGGCNLRKGKDLSFCRDGDS
jgi:hypothetical protein